MKNRAQPLGFAWKFSKQSVSVSAHSYKKPSPICVKTGINGVNRQPPCLRIIAPLDFSKDYSGADSAARTLVVRQGDKARTHGFWLVLIL